MDWSRQTDPESNRYFRRQWHDAVPQFDHLSAVEAQAPRDLLARQRLGLPPAPTS